MQELLRSTPLDHPDYQSTKEATEKISQVTTHINKDIKLSTAIKDLQRIQDDLGMETVCISPPSPPPHQELCPDRDDRARDNNRNCSK